MIKQEWEADEARDWYAGQEEEAAVVASWMIKQEWEADEARDWYAKQEEVAAVVAAWMLKQESWSADEARDWLAEHEDSGVVAAWMIDHHETWRACVACDWLAAQDGWSDGQVAGWMARRQGWSGNQARDWLAARAGWSPFAVASWMLEQWQVWSRDAVRDWLATVYTGQGWAGHCQVTGHCQVATWMADHDWNVHEVGDWLMHCSGWAPQSVAHWLRQSPYFPCCAASEWLVSSARMPPQDVAFWMARDGVGLLETSRWLLEYRQWPESAVAGLIASAYAPGYTGSYPPSSHDTQGGQWHGFSWDVRPSHSFYSATDHAGGRHLRRRLE